MSDPVPDEVARLVAERTAARERRDFAAADALRDRIRSLGWEAMDGPFGTAVRPALGVADASEVAYARAEDLASRLDEPASLDSSLVVVADDHPSDLVRFLAGLAAHPPVSSWELVVVANAPSYDLGPVLEPSAIPDPVVLGTSARLGWADAVNLGMRRARGAVIVLVDTSLEPLGDFVAPLMAAFEDPTVGVAGGFGVRSADLRQFEDAPPGEVDAIEGYCLAVRREALRAVGGFDHRFRFYRNADLDLSFALRAAGWRAIRTEPLPVRQHEHRGYTALPDQERDRLSRRNFYRFLEHWGDRRDLLVGG